jgi:hypothetical protein
MGASRYSLPLSLGSPKRVAEGRHEQIRVSAAHPSEGNPIIQRIKGTRFVKIPQATHWMQHDQSQMCNEILLGFLAEKKKN